jgi:hypothetical protein
MTYVLSPGARSSFLSATGLLVCFFLYHFGIVLSIQQSASLLLADRQLQHTNSLAMLFRGLNNPTPPCFFKIFVVTSFFIWVECFTISSPLHVARLPLRLEAMKAENCAAHFVATCVTTVVLLLPTSAAWADGQTKDFKFPPIDYGDKTRCILKGGSSMGQANAARDKLYDLRQCQLSGANAVGYDLSGVSE